MSDPELLQIAPAEGDAAAGADQRPPLQRPLPLLAARLLEREADASGSEQPAWEGSLGFLCFSSEGISLKPQFKLGLQLLNFRFDVGLGDVRDGLSVAARGEFFDKASVEGWSVKELHEALRRRMSNDFYVCSALEAAKALLSRTAPATTAARSTLWHLADSLGMDEERLAEVFLGRTAAVHGAGLEDGGGSGACNRAALAAPKRRPMRLHAEAVAEVGAAVVLCLGWCDTQGYKMVGIGGECAAALVEAGSCAFVGRHFSGRSLKLILGIAPFKFEYIIQLADTAPVGTRCESSTLDR